MTSFTEDLPSNSFTVHQDSQPPVKKLTKCGIIGNVAIISLGFLLSFTAFHATVNLQTSLYTHNSLGSKVLVVMNMAAFLSNFLLTLLINGKLGLKWSMFLCLFTHTALPATNLYPNDYVLYLGAVVTGLGAGPLWSAKSTYVTVLGEQYAELIGGNAEALTARFFGIFFMVYYAASVLGNVISSFVLQMPHQATKLSGAALQEMCAANFCYYRINVIQNEHVTMSNVSSAIELHALGGSIMNLTSEDMYHMNSSSPFSAYNRPSDHKVMMLFGILSLFSVLSCPLVALLTSLNTACPEEHEKVWPSILALFKQLKKPKEVLLVPLALHSGIIYAFITADYCLGYITCTVGIDKVGFVMSTCGIAAGLGAIVFGPLLKYTGRKAIFIFGGILNMGVLVALLKYRPTSESSLSLYVFAGLWGITTVIWISQYLAFIGYVFRDGDKEAAFACNYAWQMIGVCLWHAIDTLMCIYLQVYIMIAILSIGLVTYFILEVLLYREGLKSGILKDGPPRKYT